MNDKTRYAYRLLKAKCSCGDKTFTQCLNLPEDHGVYFQEKEFPLLNANDHVAGEHILGFGRCTSRKRCNDNIAADLIGDMLLTPGVNGLIQDFIGYRCEPMTIVPWRFADENYLIDGAPALTVKSELSCYYGGKITIETEDMAADDSDGTEEETPPDYDKKDKLPSEVQELISDFCDSEAPAIASAGDTALQLEAVLSLETREAIGSTAVSADESAVIIINME